LISREQLGFDSSGASGLHDFTFAGAGGRMVGIMGGSARQIHAAGDLMALAPNAGG
jgi:hypothetical protein